jgi:hypothetical protein
MIPIIVWIIFVVFLLDMLLTYHYVKTYKELYPKNDWTLAEANPILRTFFKKFGLIDGLIYGTILLLSILFFIIIVINENWRYFLLGFYVMTNIQHFVNWSAMKRLKLKKMKGGEK